MDEVEYPEDMKLEGIEFVDIYTPEQNSDCHSYTTIQNYYITIVLLSSILEKLLTVLLGASHFL
jgi:hypothetical protein